HPKSTVGDRRVAVRREGVGWRSVESHWRVRAAACARRDRAEVAAEWRRSAGGASGYEGRFRSVFAVIPAVRRTRLARGGVRAAACARRGRGGVAAAWRRCAGGASGYEGRFRSVFAVIPAVRRTRLAGGGLGAARPAGFEPATWRLEVSCSIR